LQKTKPKAHWHTAAQQKAPLFVKVGPSLRTSVVDCGVGVSSKGLDAGAKRWKRLARQNMRKRRAAGAQRLSRPRDIAWPHRLPTLNVEARIREGRKQRAQQHFQLRPRLSQNQNIVRNNLEAQYPARIGLVPALAQRRSGVDGAEQVSHDDCENHGTRRMDLHDSAGLRKLAVAMLPAWQVQPQAAAELSQGGGNMQRTIRKAWLRAAAKG